MTPERRLAVFLSTTLAAGCGTGPLDDVACTAVPLGDACPSPEVAAELLIGTRTCESPVREVTNIGAFVSSSDVIYTGYGGSNPYEPGDTGFSEPMTECCYEASYKEHEGEDCVIGRALRDGGAPRTATVTRTGQPSPAGPERGPPRTLPQTVPSSVRDPPPATSLVAACRARAPPECGGLLHARRSLAVHPPAGGHQGRLQSCRAPWHGACN